MLSLHVCLLASHGDVSEAFLMLLFNESATVYFAGLIPSAAAMAATLAR